MSANESSSSSLVAELSFSFQDELTATIQNALGVAVEIAVVEITKLVSQVLRGVRDQMHETLMDNKSLKFRLQAAELKLSATRDRLEEQRHTSCNKGDANNCSIGIQQVHEQLTSLNNGRVPTTVRTQDCESNGEVFSNHRVDDPSDVKEMFGILDDTPDTDRKRYSGETFREIREDGRVCTQDIKQDATEEPRLQLESQESPVTKEEQSRLRSCNQEETLRFNDKSSARGHSGPQAMSDDQAKLSGAEVKVEAAAQNCSSDTVAYQTQGDDEDFVADSLSLAQSQLLEDWRPEPLHLQSCDADTFTPSTSHSLADSPIFSADIPDLGLLPPAGTGHSVPFSKPYQHRTPAAPPTSSSAQNQLYAPQPRSQHVCKVCGQTFRLSEELRRHRKNHIRSPKKSLFPPGRSPYHCSLCGRDFNRMEHLKIHQRIHTGERPYACTVCNARFRHSWALTRHFRIHTGEKPYACGICGKTFRNCGGLRFHQRSHGVGAVGGVS